MTERLTSYTQADLEIRGSDGRTVVGIAVPFDTPTRIGGEWGFTETFKRGSFARTIAERGDRVKFLAQHEQRSMPLGKATLLREDPLGLYSEFRVSKTVAGDEALELIRDGALDGLSIGFEPVNSAWTQDRSSVVRLEAKLIEVSAVNFPAYESALIAGVRAGDHLSSTPLLVDARRRLDLLRMEPI